MARPNKYEKYVEPHLERIAQMAIDMTEEQIAKTLGVSYATFRRYKNEHEQLKAVLKMGRKDLVIKLKSNLIRKAEGFEYEETKTIKELNEDTGKLEVVRVETTKKYAPPDVAANNLLLKNYDRENWANDPQALEIKRQELELQKQKIENSEW